MKIKIRKPPEMPHWYWLANDNCWGCKNRNGCSGCSYIKKERKRIFGYKRKDVMNDR